MAEFKQFDVDGAVFCCDGGRFWVSFDFEKNQWKVEEPENKIHGFFSSKDLAFSFVDGLIKRENDKWIETDEDGNILSSGSDLDYGVHDVDVQNGNGYYDRQGNYIPYATRDCFGDVIC